MINVNTRLLLSACAVERLVGAVRFALVLLLLLVSMRASGAPDYLSPSDVVATADGKTLYVACTTGNRVLVLDAESGAVRARWDVGAAPLGLALSSNGSRLFVTSGTADGSVAKVDTANGSVTQRFAAGHTPMAPVLAPDGKTLYVCNRFNNEAVFFDLESGRKFGVVSVPREPVAAALTPDGTRLLVANHIHNGRADAEVVAAAVSVIDTGSRQAVAQIRLVNGSGLLRGVAISPDGKYACVTHQVSRYHLPTTQIERGWINTAGLTLIDLGTLKVINTVLLDNIDSGAANPWAVAWSADGKRIVVTHAGTHELTLIDAPALLAKLATMPAKLPAGAKLDYTVASHVAADVPNDLSFMVGLRERVRLPEGARGPRGLALIGSRAYVANYFSDSVARVEMVGARGAVATFALGPKQPMTPERAGEFYFNDATICFQGWQSCSSCHSSDARVDGLNWDNLNDGIGNPKNAKSLLQAFYTAPSMWLSVREDAAVAVRAGIKHSLFTVQPPEVATSLDAYLKSLQPMASPRLVKGKLSEAAERGRKLFENDTVACIDCHKGKYFTDLKSHDVGTRGDYDKPADIFDTPSLIEAWRGGPYLHDGSAATIEAVLTDRNARNEHGNVKKLTKEQLADLIEYVLSL